MKEQGKAQGLVGAWSALRDGICCVEIPTAGEGVLAGFQGHVAVCWPSNEKQRGGVNRRLLGHKWDHPTPLCFGSPRLAPLSLFNLARSSQLLTPTRGHNYKYATPTAREGPGQRLELCLVFWLPWESNRLFYLAVHIAPLGYSTTSKKMANMCSCWLRTWAI